MIQDRKIDEMKRENKMKIIDGGLKNERKTKTNKKSKKKKYKDK